MFPFSALAANEPRIGIAREIASRTVKLGFLYNEVVHRWRARTPWKQNTSYGLRALVANAESKHFPSPLVLRLGGEGRIAYGRIDSTSDSWLDKTQKTEIRAAIDQKGGWLLTLASPAALRAGWVCDWMKGDADHGWKAVRTSAAGNSLDCGRLVGFVSTGAIVQSGWDLAGKGREAEPKPIRRYCPAGTTWFFELPPALDVAVRKDVLDCIDALQGTCIADHDAHAGYGLAFVGAWANH